jgi:hypothetical protein
MANRSRTDGGKTVAANRSQRRYVRLEVLESDRPLLREAARKLRDESGAKATSFGALWRASWESGPNWAARLCSQALLYLESISPEMETWAARLICDLPRRHQRLTALQA